MDRLRPDSEADRADQANQSDHVVEAVEADQTHGYDAIRRAGFIPLSHTEVDEPKRWPLPARVLTYVLAAVAAYLVLAVAIGWLVLLVYALNTLIARVAAG